MAIKYMHLVNSKPAFFLPGEQLYFANFRKVIPLADSLKQIRREQKASQKWREKKGYGTEFVYSHQRILT